MSAPEQHNNRDYMMTKQYTPGSDSIAGRVIAHLREAGDGATLTFAEIGRMTNTATKNVGQVLRAAVAHHALSLEKRPNNQGTIVRLGDGVSPIAAQKAQSKPYRPEAGTVPARVVAHLQERPELYELSSATIAAMFEIPTKNVAGALASCVKAGLLSVRREGRSCFYRAGSVSHGCHPTAPNIIATAAPTRHAAHGLTAALYNDGELYMHGVQRMEDGGVLLSAAQTAELRAYLLHTGQVSAIASANGGSLT